MIDIKNKTIEEINSEIKHKMNELEYYLDIKYKNWLSTQPKATDYSKENVQGGSRANKFEAYLIKDESVDKQIEDLQNEIYRLTRYVEKELARIGELKPLTKIMVELKEQGKTQQEIAENTKYSVRQVQRILKKYYTTRNID